jgi:hypothetical protein
MPRVENLGKNVDAWWEEEQEGSSTFDVCFECHGILEHDPHAFDEELAPYNGDPSGDAGRGGDVEHPSYGEYDIDYDCEVCGDKLTAADD